MATVPEDQKAKNVEALETALKVAAVSGKQSIMDSGTFPLAKIATVPGNWYCGIECQRCSRTTPICRDFAEGKIPQPFSGSGFVKTECHYCSKPIKAKSNQILSFQWS